MAEDYMQSGDSGESSNKTESSDSQDSQDMAETFLAPSSAFGGDCKPGDKYTVEVVSKHGDELELKHLPKEDKDEATESEPDEAHASIDRGVAKMAGMGMMA